MPRIYACLISLILFWSSSTFADDDAERSNRRILTSLEWFPKIINIDRELSQKRTPQGNLNVVFVYQNNREAVERIAKNFQQRFPRIGQYTVQVLIVNTQVLPSLNYVSAVFIGELLNKSEIKTILKYAENERVLIFSPFKGDVEKGIASGIATAGRIQPYFNKSALRRANLMLDEHVLNSAKLYE